MAFTPDDERSRPNRGLEALGVSGDGALYQVALTHRSFAFENADPLEHNERLEFLGDAVLGLIVTDLIYRSHPEMVEGDMARLRASIVNTQALAELARTLDIGAHLRLGKGEESSGGRDKNSLLADTLEALIGAVYLERGIEFVTARLTPLLVSRIDERMAEGSRYDVKTALQEIAVRRGAGFPSYRVAASGPDHAKRFTAQVYVAGELLGSGDGASKKDAEQQAARVALTNIDRPTGGGDDERESDARAS